MKYDNTYYAAYHYSYEYFDETENDWVYSTTYDMKYLTGVSSQDIPKIIENEIIEKMKGEDIKDFSFEMDELSIITDDEY